MSLISLGIQTVSHVVNVKWNSQTNVSLVKGNCFVASTSSGESWLQNPFLTQSRLNQHVIPIDHDLFRVNHQKIRNQVLGMHAGNPTDRLGSKSTKQSISPSVFQLFHLSKAISDWRWTLSTWRSTIHLQRRLPLLKTSSSMWVLSSNTKHNFTKFIDTTHRETLLAWE